MMKFDKDCDDIGFDKCIYWLYDDCLIIDLNMMIWDVKLHQVF